MEVREPSARYLKSAPYKQTELGPMPLDWEVTTVGAKFSIQLGKMLDAEKNQGTRKPFLGNRAVQWGRIELADLGEIRLTPSDLQRYRLRPGDLLVCEGGEVGRCAIWQEPVEECYFQKSLHRLRPKERYGVELVAQVLRQQSESGALQNYVTQTSIAHLPKDKFETVLIPLPPTATERNAIATALCDADALIESLEQLLAKKRQLKQGAMQELLTGKRRLPGFGGPWLAKTLGQLAKIQRGASPRPIESPIWFDATSPIGWVRISDVTSSKRWLRGTTQQLSPLGVKNSRPVSRGNLIMSICATVGRPVVTEIDVCIHDGFVVFDDLKVDRDFLYFFLASIESQWSRHGQTGSQMNLNTGLINRTEISVPQIREEQVAIATVLSDLDTELEAIETQLTKARHLKQGMAQALLTGRIRLV